MNKKLKIIQLNSSSILGGGQKVMFYIIDGLKEYFDFTALAPSGFFLDKYQEKNISIIDLKKRDTFLIIGEIKKIIRKYRPDIIHSHGTRAAIWLRLAIIGLKNKPRIVYTLHGFHIPKRNFFARWALLALERFLNRWTDILVCVSEADKKLVLKYKVIPKDKIIIIKNGIDIKEFQIDQQKIDKAKQELRLKDNFILTAIGRLHQQKDFSTILGALKLILLQNVRINADIDTDKGGYNIKNSKDFYKLLIVGDGPLKKSLEKEVKELNIEPYVKFLGFREDIPVLINLSDLVILSTRWEGLPLIPLEVGAAKKLIIASDVEGVRETIIARKTGYLFKSGSKKDLAEKISELAGSEELRKKISKNAFEYVLKNFDQKIMIDKYKKLYEGLDG